MNITIRSAPLFVELLLVLSAPVAWSEQTHVRSYPLLDHGTLQLTVPLSWQDNLQDPSQGSPATIAFKSKTGASFDILLTPVLAVAPHIPPLTADDLRRKVEGAAEHARSQSIEKVIKVKELKGSSGLGYYFSATDRAPKPGEYTYMTQGARQVGSLLLTFTILTNDGQTQTVVDALTMLRSAAHVTQ
jgi:hypothetical protein